MRLEMRKSRSRPGSLGPDRRSAQCRTGKSPPSCLRCCSRAHAAFARWAAEWLNSEPLGPAEPRVPARPPASACSSLAGVLVPNPPRRPGKRAKQATPASPVRRLSWDEPRKPGSGSELEPGPARKSGQQALLISIIPGPQRPLRPSQDLLNLLSGRQVQRPPKGQRSRRTTELLLPSCDPSPRCPGVRPTLPASH